MSKGGLLFLLFFLCFKTYGQDYAPVETYLVDSLDLSAVSEKDRALIDSVLTIYRGCDDEICMLKAIGEIVQDSWDANVWPKYNRWIHDYTAKRLTDESLDSTTVVNLSVSYAGALNNIGYLFNATDQIDSALYYYDRCLVIQENMGDKNGMAGTLINTGYIFLNQGFIEKALEYYYRSLALQEELKNQPGIATALNGIGYMQYKLGDVEAALKSYDRSLVMRRELGDDYGTATCLNNIGLVFKDEGQWDKALTYFQECMTLQEKLGDQNGIAIALSNIGFVYNGMDMWNRALENYRQSLRIMESLDDKSGIANALNSIAGVELTKGNENTARRGALRSLTIAREIKFPEAIRDAAQTLHKIEKRARNWEEALTYYELYVQMRDSVFNQETVTASIHQQYKYRYERQSMADSIKNANAQQIAEAQLMASEAETDRLSALSTKQRQQTYFLVFGVFSAFIFSATIFNRMKTIKRQKETIASQNEELELQKKNLSNFAHTISHDLKTPISGIVGLLNLVEYENPELKGELRERLELIKKSALDSSNLITGVLAYSEAGRMSMDVSNVNLNNLLKGIIKDIPNKNEVQVQVAEELPTLLCNTYQITQVFTNIIGNAIKYNDKAKGHGTVSVQYSKTQEFHEFVISDNGPGIPEESQSTVFEIFTKSNQEKNVEGTGIGLSIARQLVNQNGGSIRLNSPGEQGASFTFTWPL
ncbi:MAG: sensor histidine kinase [Roseivirga sp.]|nr:sensor histidine kinase [Roseivirga sp.]